MRTRKSSIQITAFDLQRLKKLVEEETQHETKRGIDYFSKLQAEVDRAQVVEPQAVSSEVVTMNSTVVLFDLDSGEQETYTLVFPENADAVRGKISILAPIGTAMLGYKVGDVFEWEVPAGIRRLRVDQILYQPEAAGNYRL